MWKSWHPAQSGKVNLFEQPYQLSALQPPSDTQSVLGNLFSQGNFFKLNAKCKIVDTQTEAEGINDKGFRGDENSKDDMNIEGEIMGNFIHEKFKGVRKNNFCHANRFDAIAQDIREESSDYPGVQGY